MKKPFFPLQTTPISAKLLKQQRRGRESRLVTHVLFFVQTLPRLNGLVESFLLDSRWLFLDQRV
ncbi:MAG: hypothetical protein IJW49_03495, partial [Clostridia bacterium]|nr:hypothetical protein [Clostridia bacterium]